MLYMRCQLGEVIKVGDNIEILISRIRGGEVTIGISAPKEIKIDRSESRKFVHVKEPIKVEDTECKQKNVGVEGN